jgi:indolepyruvate ferredoxin oxidoreductase, alpha subunit
VFEILRDMDCIVSGDIGCYTLGVLPPFEAMDTCVCMGASIGVGLGLRHVLPEAQARRVVSVIGDSTFVHSGLTGLAEMVYNPPKTGHVLLFLDNNTTAMTGLQEHPGTGRALSGEMTHKLIFENIARAMGIPNVHTLKGGSTADDLEKLLHQALASNDLTLIVVRNPCLLSAKRDSKRDKARVGQE